MQELAFPESEYWKNSVISFLFLYRTVCILYRYISVVHVVHRFILPLFQNFMPRVVLSLSSNIVDTTVFAGENTKFSCKD